jgi:uncharacterized protein
MDVQPSRVVSERIAVLERGSKLLLMDRYTGRSVYAPKTSGQTFRLLGTSEDRLPPELASLRRELTATLASQGIGGPLPPRSDTLNTLILKLTNACNYACTYCYDYEPEETATTLDLELAIRSVTEALESCTTGLQVVFHGGEPFLVFEHIKQIVVAGEDRARHLGKQVIFAGQTNLSRLTAETISFSQEHGIHWGFSLDGPARQNDVFRVLRNGAGTHDRFERALGQFPEFVRSCSAMATITSANYDNLLGISRYFQSRGLRGWDWSLFQPIGRGRWRPEVYFEIDKLIDSWNELFDAVVSGEFDGFAISPIIKYVDNFINGPGRNMCMRKGCGAARDLLSISSDGQIEACDCIDPHGPLSDLGNTKLITLTRAHESETAKLIRSRDVEKGRCGTCIWLAVCGGTCMARAQTLDGICEDECQLALNAFDRISSHLSESARLREYLSGCYGSRN